MQIHELPSGTPTDSDLLPFDTGSVNYKTPFSGFDLKENTATFTSADEADPAQFKTVDPIETGPIKTILNRLSMAVSNIRYIWKVLSSVVNKTAIINYNDSSGGFNISHDETHRIILNSGLSGGWEIFRVDNGTIRIDTNSQLGYFDLKVGTSNINHRLYIANGTGDGYPEGMVLRCGDSYIEMKPDESFLTVRNSGSQYITFNGNQSRLNIVYESDSIALDASTHRMSIVASGGVVINGTLTASGSFTTANGKTVTVKNGMITAIS